MNFVKQRGYVGLINCENYIMLIWTNTEIKSEYSSCLDTWSGFEAAKTAPCPNWDSTTLVNSLCPNMRLLGEDVIVSCSVT